MKTFVVSRISLAYGKTVSTGPAKGDCCQMSMRPQASCRDSTSAIATKAALDELSCAWRIRPVRKDMLEISTTVWAAR